MHRDALRAREGARAEGRLEHLVDRTEALAQRIAEPYAFGLRFVALSLAYQLVGRFRESAAATDSAEVFLRDCAGTAYQLATRGASRSTRSTRLGRLREVCRRLPSYLRDAAIAATSTRR